MDNVNGKAERREIRFPGGSRDGTEAAAAGDWAMVYEPREKRKMMAWSWFDGGLDREKMIKGRGEGESGAKNQVTTWRLAAVKGEKWREVWSKGGKEGLKNENGIRVWVF
ncbi:hypothetical protein HAX54_015121 [Datura stramonium]|uniref:Uncharacterized protein n=1 Tax=Datura stramonium TaxID=4076 RepID=A0ABS8TP43_DATST|nr:hypothetical protein [Datura stramonium]